MWDSLTKPSSNVPGQNLASTTGIPVDGIWFCKSGLTEDKELIDIETFTGVKFKVPIALLIVTVPLHYL